MKITGMCLLRNFILAAIGMAFFHTSSFGEIYRWKDAEGTVHLTEDPSRIPPEYRDQTRRSSLSSDPQISASSGGNPSCANGRDANNLKYFELPYQGYEGALRRIIIPVTFNGAVTASLLLDTGAPGLVITPVLAERLGLLNSEAGGLKITAGGIGGTTPATLTVVDSIQVGEACSKFLPATITAIESKHFEGLVGMDFLAGYRISIDTGRNVLEFKELPAQENIPGGRDEIWWRSNFRNIAGMKEVLSRYLREVEKNPQAGHDGERLKEAARHQLSEAEKLYNKLERFANENAVPHNWR